MPGGNELVFTAAGTVRNQIVALDPETSSQRTLVSEEVNVGGASLAPDGRRIAYYRCCTAYNQRIALRDLTTGMVGEVGRGVGKIRWSPDGAWLAMQVDRRVDRIVAAIRLGDGVAARGWAGATPLWLP